MASALSLSNHRCSSSPLSRLRLTSPLSVQHPSPLKLRCLAKTPSPTLRNLNLRNLDSRVFPLLCYRRRGVTCLAMAEPNSTPSVFQETITLGFVKEMIEDFKNGKPLDKKYVHQILEQSRDLFLPLPSVVDICVPDGKHLTVCDDLHGQFEDLMHMFELNGLPSKDNPYIFTGEFENRGEFSAEVLLTLFAFKCWCPSAIYLTRANHVDDEHMNKVYGFEREMNSKLGGGFLQHFVGIFHCLPLAYVINQKIAVAGDKYKIAFPAKHLVQQTPDKRSHATLILRFLGWGICYGLFDDRVVDNCMLFGVIGEFWESLLKSLGKFAQVK